MGRLSEYIEFRVVLVSNAMAWLDEFMVEVELRS